MKHNLAIKVLPLRIIKSHNDRGVILTVTDLADLMATNYNTSWNRLYNLKKAKLITSTTRPRITPMGKSFLNQHGKNKKCSLTKKTTTSATNVLTTHSDLQKRTLITFSALVIGSLLTLALQNIL